jgi:ATP-dependent RNA helicase RhlE
MTFEELGLAPPILRAVQEEGYTEPTPVQAQAIPLIIQGRDVKASAQTGTGKTAAFTLPILHRLAAMANNSPSPAMHPVRALIIAPTRELAVQVEESVRTYGRHLPLRTLCVYGGVNIDSQIKTLLGGVEILVATPGRLLDHVQQRTVNFGSVQFLVLDEADRMLDMGFLPDIRRILMLLPPQRQNLLFSATFPDEIKRLCDSLLKDPAVIQVASRNTAAETVRQVVYLVDSRKKRELLVHLIKNQGIKQALIFCSTKLSTSRLAVALHKEGIPAAAIHGDKSQQQRTEALDAFKKGEVGILVATDVAGRGIDIDNLPHVINFELPPSAEDYVHRIGRTGRAGAEGDAISLVSEEEMRQLADIERLIKRTLPREPLPGMRPHRIAGRDEREPVRAERPPRTAPLPLDVRSPRFDEEMVQEENQGRLPRFDRESANPHRPPRGETLNAIVYAIHAENIAKRTHANETEQQDRRKMPALFQGPPRRQRKERA